MAVTCRVCTADNQDEVEAVGLKALAGELSWRAAGREVGWSNYASIKTHMERHYVAEQVRVANDDMDRLIAESVRELQNQFVLAPPEVKPLLLAAIHNVQELRNTKPSQQHLIQALKTVQEMTGMKQEQRMMVLFAKAMFAEVDAPVPAPAIEAPVIDVEPVEADEMPLPVEDVPAKASKPRSRRVSQKA